MLLGVLCILHVQFSTWRLATDLLMISKYVCKLYLYHSGGTDQSYQPVAYNYNTSQSASF